MQNQTNITIELSPEEAQGLKMIMLGGLTVFPDGEDQVFGQQHLIMKSIKDKIEKAQQPPVPPKPAIRRLYKDDVPELEMRLIDYNYTVYPAGVATALAKRHRAELFLCIECLKLGGWCFSKPNLFMAATIKYNLDDGQWSVYHEDVITTSDFFFSNKDVAHRFLAISGIIDALHEFYMIDKL